LKRLLHAAGAEIRKVYDVSGALRRNLDRLAREVGAEIDTLVSASRRLREERELAFYGDEETDTEAERCCSPLRTPMTASVPHDTSSPSAPRRQRSTPYRRPISTASAAISPVWTQSGMPTPR